MRERLLGARGRAACRGSEVVRLPEPLALTRTRGCALPSPTPRRAHGQQARETFEAHLRALVAEVEGRAETSALTRGRALATLALFAGSLMLSRAVVDRSLSDRILLASRRLALAGLDDPTPSREKKP
jgi:hypothetical protein